MSFRKSVENNSRGNERSGKVKTRFLDAVLGNYGLKRSCPASMNQLVLMGQRSGLPLQMHMAFRKARIYTEAESFNHRQDTRSQLKQARNQRYLNIKAY